MPVVFALSDRKINNQANYWNQYMDIYPLNFNIQVLIFKNHVMKKISTKS
jgi:hypothetical protein